MMALFLLFSARTHTISAFRDLTYIPFLVFHFLSPHQGVGTKSEKPRKKNKK